MAEHRYPLALVGGDHVLEPAHDPLLEVLKAIAEDAVLEVVEIEVVGSVGIVGRHLLERDIRVGPMVRLD